MDPARSALWIARGAPATALAVCVRLFLLLLLGTAASFSRAAPQEGPSTEVGVQAAFLFKFGSYVEWPAEAFPSADAPLRIAVVGARDLARALDAIAASRSVLGRPVSVHALQHGAPLDGFHIVFVDDAQGGALGASIASLGNNPTLVVTKSDGALADGSTINFVIDEGKLRFDVSLDAANARGLRISSRLLAVARRVAGVGP